jgi:deoxyribodipyrimidine photo-lyase
MGPRVQSDEKMPSKIIQADRIRELNRAEIRDRGPVLYWMQQSQRAEYNHALEYAVQQANELDRPLLVVFGLTQDYPEGNLRHYAFMLEGLRETQAALARRGIGMQVYPGYPAEVALKAGEKAALIVCDCGYLRHQRVWRRKVAMEARCRVVQVETDAVMPVGVVSDKAEFAARTIRPKIHRSLDEFLVEMRTTPLRRSAERRDASGLDLTDMEGVLSGLRLDRGPGPVSRFFQGGTTQARRRLADFIEHRVQRYDDHHNQPHTDDVSHMSMYLHFGQISPLYVAMQIRQAEDIKKNNKDAFLEELLVRRELAINYVSYTENYETFAALPDWAKTTLAEHRRDRREHVYSLAQLEGAETHDPYWNAAMQEMRQTGYMHNYMRMYWGKKILEWSETPQEAFAAALALNNKYFLDGRDANSYANIAWLFGLHDRPWPERPIFGKVRYMSASGLERKCDMESYIEKVERLDPTNRIPETP